MRLFSFLQELGPPEYRWPSFSGAVVIDYFAIGVLVFIALLAVARLFPPPDRAR
jgi:hypothetical protein